MFTYRTCRRIGEILVVLTLGLLVVLASNASAVSHRAHAASTKQSAERKALKIQKNDCKWGFPLLYKCRQPYFLFPACQATGIDQPGKPQWICGGLFVRQQVLSGALQFCYTQYFLSPWNTEQYSYGSGYKCYGSLLTAGDKHR